MPDCCHKNIQTVIDGGYPLKTLIFIMNHHKYLFTKITMVNLFSGYIVKIRVNSGGWLVDSQSTETCKCFDNLKVVYWLNLSLCAEMTHRAGEELFFGCQLKLG